MKNLLENIDAKMVREAGLFLALIASLFVLLKIMTNDFAHLRVTVAQQQEIQKETNSVLRDLSKSIEGNTRVMESLLRQR